MAGGFKTGFETNTLKLFEKLRNYYGNDEKLDERELNVKKFYKISKYVDYRVDYFTKSSDMEMMSQKDVSPVINDILHGLFAVYPQTRYKAGWNILFKFLAALHKYGPQDKVGYMQTQEYLAFQGASEAN